MSGAPKPRGVLLVSHDMLTPFAKTTDYLAEAFERRGIPAYVRDTADARIMHFLFSGELVGRLPEAEKVACENFRNLIRDTGVDTVLSLDLNWFLAPGLFTDDAAINRVHSLWFDDFRSWCISPWNPVFSADGAVFQQNVRHPKVLHHFYGDSQSLEGKLLGFTSQRLTRLAAPRQLLDCDGPCTRTDKLAFIGNPGFRGLPHPKAVEMMEAGAEIDELRQFSRDMILQFPEDKAAVWYQHEPQVRDLVAAAVEARRRFPYQPAMKILELCRSHVPRGFDFANENGLMLDLAFLVKLVNRYDRPAFVHRLAKRGLIDVYSAGDEWKPYNVTALPYVQFRDLPNYYRMYAAHLNAPNSIRDATANEKLFEIAACGRLSINLDSPDVRSCFDPGEIGVVTSLAGLEAEAEQVLRAPDEALASGEKARQRCAAEHLWDHRVETLLA